MKGSLRQAEEDVQRFWRRRGVAGAARAARHDGAPCVIYVEPLAAVGQPRIDQVRLLATADLLARHRTMAGAAVQLRLGWQDHGLAVEVAAEGALAEEDERADLARFNAFCRQMAAQGVGDGEELAGRLGLWSDPRHAYLASTRAAVGAVWGALRRLWDAGRLRREQRVVPFCPRCATPLSAAEAARQAVEEEGRSAWVLLPWDGEPDAYLLVWTAVSWTLVGMVAVAAHPGASYVLAELPGEEGTAPLRLVVAEAALEQALAGEGRLVRRLATRALADSAYHPPFTFLPASEGLAGVVLSDQVSPEHGSGLLPVTPSFDAPSLALAGEHGLPVPYLLDEWGGFDEAVTLWRGLSPPDVGPLLVEELRARGLLLRQKATTVSRALCPYCQAGLLPLARPVWLAETGSGPWVVGRERAWGAPLPIWVCQVCDAQTCVAGLDDLAHRLGLEAGQIEPHRPDLDRLVLPCEQCGGTMQRVPEVTDARFEAAILPWAPSVGAAPGTQAGRGSGTERGLHTERLAVGLGDRELGWLGDVAEAVALLRGGLAWEQAVALSQEGLTASWDTEAGQPADALRWAAYAGCSPEEAEARLLQPLWHLAMASPGMEVEAGAGTVGALLGRWLEARLYQVTAEVGAALDACRPARAAAALAGLVEDWGWCAPLQLEEGLSPGRGEAWPVLIRLLAPFVPHLAEAMHRQRAGATAESVHLATWPAPPDEWRDEALLARVDRVRRAEGLGRAAREAAGIPAARRVPQAVVAFPAGDVPDRLDGHTWQSLLARLLAAGRVEIVAGTPPGVTWRLVPVGNRLPGGLAAILGELAADEAQALARQLRAGLSVQVESGSGPVTLLPDEVRIHPEVGTGRAAAMEGELLVVLDVG
ncbi:MAG: class I tRNA ligase family protein [Anaerolineae bacterium]